VYRRILVPMEDEQQEPAASHARALAASNGGTVVLAWLVPVLDSGERFFTQIQVEPGSSGARRKEQGEAYLARARQAFAEQGVALEAQVVVTPLPPEQAIVDLAAEEEIDLIVMTTLPQSAVGRFLFGSVGEKVRRRATVPVLFVSPIAEEGGKGA
jgi:nucleotide-binding universal stress UspA family protein